ncbi:SGNH/GDSL hydrolase family protein [soil metagenome]
MKTGSLSQSICCLLATFLVAGSVHSQEAVNKRPDPKRFIKEIEKFEELDKSAPPTKGGIVFTGSSSIRLWKTTEAFPDLPVLNRGFGGSVANDLIVYFDTVVTPYEPKVLVLYTGSNDLNANLTVEEVVADYTKFLGMVHDKFPITKVIVNSVKTSIKRWDQYESVKQLNVALESWSKGKDWIVWVEATSHLLGSDGKPRPEIFREDKLHLNDTGYAEWNAIISPYLHEEWAKLKTKK